MSILTGISKWHSRVALKWQKDDSKGRKTRHNGTTTQDNMVPPLHMCEPGTAGSDLGECRGRVDLCVR